MSLNRGDKIFKLSSKIFSTSSKKINIIMANNLRLILLLVTFYFIHPVEKKPINNYNT
jgi:hypothetical protein